ncbi:MAG: hybrid sensor histidine kinase/response regulator [Candidatus Pacebacteria bacterium]|nr:hybrid sensor histidine kinase/response regulator [Candidatus Paceibacterota bacterium]
MNKELSLILGINRPLDSSPNSTGDERSRLYRSPDPDPFVHMVEVGDQEKSLREIMFGSKKWEENKHEQDAEEVHHMTLEGKPYELKTKYIAMTGRKECKIAVITDQSVYENLVKEKTMEKYQRMLLASISHEIRNPLNAIEGYLTFLKEQDKTDLEDYIAKIRWAAQQIDLIVTGACDLLLNEGKTMILQPQRFDLREIIDSVVAIVTPNLEKKQLIMKVSQVGAIPRRITSDPKRYKIVLFQLLANAVKYTEKGKIEISIKYDEDTQIVTTVVNDTGIGMNEDTKEKIFQLYTNLEKANTYNPQGMGLGLALCRKLARLLGGDVICVSSVGSGSSFTMTMKNYEKERKGSAPRPELRFAGPNGEEVQKIQFFYPSPSATSFHHAASSNTIPSRACSCAQVLIVDDEATNRAVLAHYLKSISVTSEGVENGSEAVVYVKQRIMSECCNKYKLIIMDINMPIMDGTEATAILMKLFEANPALKTPIVAVTAANMQTRTDMQNLLSVGFSDIRNNRQR